MCVVTNSLLMSPCASFPCVSAGADGRASLRGDGAQTQPRSGPQRQAAATGGKAAALSAQNLCVYALHIELS